MSNDMREAIVNAMYANIDTANPNADCGVAAAADAIIDALPSMVEPLVWDGFMSGPYVIVFSEDGIADLYYFGNRDEGGDAELITGGYLTLVTLDELKSEAQAHHTAKIMAAFGIAGNST